MIAPAEEPGRVTITFQTNGLPPNPGYYLMDLLADPIGTLGATALNITVEGPERQLDLDALQPALETPIGGLNIDPARRLGKIGIHTIRHALVVGSFRVNGVLGIGEKTILKLGNAIRRKCGGDLRLLKRPTVPYVATFCRNLGEVPLVALSGWRYSGEPQLSVADATEGSEPFLSACRELNMGQFGINSLVEKAQEFAEEFASAGRRAA